MPVRKIGMSSRSVTWDFSSVKTNSTHKCESTLEFEFMYLIEFDPHVISFEAQPISLSYINTKGRKTRYTPDFKVIYTKKGAQEKGYQFSLVEVKYKQDLVRFKEDYAPGFQVADVYCKENGGQFEVIDEDHIKTPRLACFKFLHRYLDASNIPKLPFDPMALARELRVFTPSDWINWIDGSTLLRGQAVSNLWHLVATQKLEIDFDSKINMNSVIKVNEN